ALSSCVWRALRTSIAYSEPMWAWIGLGAAAVGAVVALRRARSRGTNFYEQEVYAMTHTSHVRFGLVSGAFAAAFALVLMVHPAAAVPILAVYTVLFLLYGATFVRGATGEDE
ncbi:MAG TPA: hypothetical protein VGD50_01965, partial [Candidatus Baltobacteraceae bacterium]